MKCDWTFTHSGYGRGSRDRDHYACRTCGTTTSVSEDAPPPQTCRRERTPGEVLASAEISAQWRAFDKVLNWINSQENKVIPKKELYHAVMEMRPEEQK